MKSFFARYWAAIGAALASIALLLGFVLPQPWAQSQVDQSGVGAWVIPAIGQVSEIHLLDTAEGGVACTIPIQRQVGDSVASDGLTSVLWGGRTVAPLDPRDCKIATSLGTLKADVHDVAVGGGTVVAATSSGVLVTSGTDGKLSDVPFKAPGASIAAGHDGSVAVLAGQNLHLRNSAGSWALDQPSVSCSSSCSLRVVNGHPVVLSNSQSEIWFDSGATSTVRSGSLLGSSASVEAPSVPVISSSGVASFDASGNALWSVSETGAPLAAATDWQGCTFAAWLHQSAIRYLERCANGQSTVQTYSENGSTGCQVPSTARKWTFQPAVQGEVLNAPNGDAYFLLGGKLQCQKWGWISRTGAAVSASVNRSSQPSRTITCVPTTFYWSSNTSAPQWNATQNCHDSAGYPTWVKTGSITPSPPSILGADDQSISLNPGQSPPPSVTYEVTDGAANSLPTTATISTNVSADQGPQLEHPARTVYLRQGEGTTYRAVDDWYSALGTPVTVVSAVESSQSSTSVHVQDGQAVVISNYSGQPESIQVTVEDTMGRKNQYVIPVQPATSNGSPPVVHDVVATGTAGSAISASLLAGDTDPGGGGLSVKDWTPVSAPTTSTGCAPLVDGTVSCTFGTPGEYVWTYDVVSATTGLKSLSFARFDVTSGSSLQAESVAINLPQDGQATADLLGPEVNRGLEVAVASVQCPSAVASCALIQNRYLKVVWLHGVDPFPVPFTVTDGPASATADLWVTPFVVPPNQVPQLATLPQQNVAPGGITKAAVLLDAYSPHGWPLQVTAAGLLPGQSCTGVSAWTDGTDVYVGAQTTSAPGLCKILYSAQEIGGQQPLSVPGVLEVEVSGAAPAPTSAPTLVLRAHGSQGAVPVPTDSVGAVGGAQEGAPVSWLPYDVGTPNHPSCGTAKLSADGQFFEYQARSNCASSTDSFSYRMLLFDGAEVIGRVDVVGITPESTCQDPAAIPVTRYVPNGLDQLQITVADSISDPCGRTVGITGVLGTPACLKAAIGRGGVVVVSGLQGCPSSVTFRYSFAVTPASSSRHLLGSVTIVRGTTSSTLTSRTGETPVSPSASVDLNSYVSGNVGALTYKMIAGPCSINGTSLQAPAQPPQNDISPCAYLATDSATGSSVGGVIWIAGRNPIIRQLQTDEVLVLPRKPKTIDLVGGGAPYFDVVPTSNQLQPSNVQLNAGCSAGQATLDRDQVLLKPSGATQSQQCTLDGTLTVSPSQKTHQFSLPVLFEGQQPPSISTSCSRPSLYPAEAQVPWDVSSCIDLGGYAPADLHVTASSSDSGVVSLDSSELNGSDPIVLLKAAPNTAGQSVTITLTVDDTFDQPSSGRFQVRVGSAPCSITAGSSSVQMQQGTSKTVPVDVIATGGSACSWRLTPAIAVSQVTVTGGAAETLGTRITGDGKSVLLNAPTLTAGESESFSVSFTANIVGDNSLVASSEISVDLQGPPSAPSIDQVTAVSKTAEVSVTFSAPANNGGSEITGYTACAKVGTGACKDSPGAVLCLTAASPCVFMSGLNENQTYQISVWATNGLPAESPESTPVQVTVDGPPPAPTDVNAVDDGDGYATLAWKEAAVPGTTPDPVTGFVATASSSSGGSGQCPLTSAPTCQMSLKPGQSYSFSVIAQNSYGDSTAGVLTTPVPITAPPSVSVSIEQPDCPSGRMIKCTATAKVSVTPNGDKSCVLTFRLSNQLGDLIRAIPQDALDSLSQGNPDPCSGSNAVSFEIQDLTAWDNYTLTVSIGGATAASKVFSFTQSPGVGTGDLSMGAGLGCTQPDSNGATTCTWDEGVPGTTDQYSLTMNGTTCNPTKGGSVQGSASGWELSFSSCPSNVDISTVTYTLNEGTGHSVTSTSWTGQGSGGGSGQLRSFEKQGIVCNCGRRELLEISDLLRQQARIKSWQLQ